MIMTKNLYIPIKVENLAFYLNSASFAPANFYEQRGRDVQSALGGNAVLMSTKQLVGESDCAIEVCLVDDECQEPRLRKISEVSEDCYLFYGFLPMSRLVKICFASQELMEHIVSQISLNTAFLSKDFCQVGVLTKSDSQIQLFPESSTKDNLFDAYHNYQRLLGGAALMRLVYDAPYTYSRGYLPFIAKLNSYVKSLMENADLDVESKGYFGESDWYALIQDIESNPETRPNRYADAIKEFAHNSGLIVEENRSMHTIKTDNLSGGALVFAYLKDYKVDDADTGGRLTIDGLICNRFDDIKSAEDVAFFFGYSRGYSRFTKLYDDIAYKYDVDSWLDMYVVETIYQRAYRKGKDYISGTFPYIDNRYVACAKKYKLSDGEFMLLDQYVICKKKAPVGSDEWFEGFFQRSVAKVEGVLKALGEYIAPKLFDDATKWIRREMRDIMRPLILDAISEKDKEMRRKLAEAEQNYALQLKEVNRDLFDEIDTNHDGILSYEEIHAFLDRLATTYNRVKQISVNVEQNQNRDSIVDNGVAGTSKSDSAVSQVSESLPSNKKRSTTRTPRQTSKKRSEPQLF